MPFKKGEVANPKGTAPYKHTILKWAEIDKDIAVAAKFLATVVDGTDSDIKDVKYLQDRLEIKINASAQLIRLAPVRQTDGEGKPLFPPLTKEQIRALAD